MAFRGREGFVPLFDLLHGLVEVGRRLGYRGVAPPTAHNPVVLQKLLRANTQVGVLLEALHEKVTGGLRFG